MNIIQKKLHTLIEAYRDSGVQGVRQKVREFLFRHWNEFAVKKDIGAGFGVRKKFQGDDIPYSSSYQENTVYDAKKPDVKALAFYLPQYHTFPENDKWWGKGFTDWVNTAKCTQARFEGHYQPRIPHKDIGYYDLSDIRNMEKQVKLAKEHGIYGFCFYYYWFSGKRLMEKPVDMLIEHHEIDIPFCLCWANENWTRRWDGQAHDILIGQEYSDENDERFMLDLKRYIDDKRYIRIHGKPLILVYNPGQIPSCGKSFSKWRETARKIGIGEILIWVCATTGNSVKGLNISEYVDAEVEFPPHNMCFNRIRVKNLKTHSETNLIFNYQQLVEIWEERLKKPSKDYPVPIYRTCMMGWDNSARRQTDWMMFYAYSLGHLYRWMRAMIKRSRADFCEEERFVFINAWNEWAEGTYLEPDKKYGYANINTISKALYDLPFEEDSYVIGGDMPAIERDAFEKESGCPRIAVHVHMYYTETLDSVMNALSEIPYRYDCYISTDTEEKKKLIELTWTQSQVPVALSVQIVPNRGRDVAPFLIQMAPVLNRYDYICHIHSKKTEKTDYGTLWREYNFKHLLGGKEYIARLLALFERKPDLGIAFPQAYPAVAHQVEWGANRSNCQKLLEKLGIYADLPSTPVFPVGNMFWARSQAIMRMVCSGLTYDMFPKEKGQLDATIAHAIERSWVYVAGSAGYRFAYVFNNCQSHLVKIQDKKRLVLYAHYDENNEICDDDVRMIRALSELAEVIVVSNNASLPENEQLKVRPFIRRIYLRENRGFDFGAWRDGMMFVGVQCLNTYDEVVLVNNSIVGPVFPLEHMFERMEQRKVDFWGTYLFPYSEDGSYVNESCIPAHIQSYFMVFHRNVVLSEAFQSFWADVKDYDRLIDVVKYCEIKLTNVLAQAGYCYSAYIKESEKLGQWLKSGAVPYEYPDLLLLLGMPFYKKKANLYMSDKTKKKLRAFLDAIS